MMTIFWGVIIPIIGAITGVGITRAMVGRFPNPRRYAVEARVNGFRVDTMTTRRKRSTAEADASTCDLLSAVAGARTEFVVVDRWKGNR